MIRKIIIVTSIVVCVAMLVLVVFYRSKTCKQLHTSVSDITKNDHFALHYIKEILPQDAYDINYLIQFPGGKFKLSFGQSEQMFKLYIEHFELIRFTKIDSMIIVDNIDSIYSLKNGYEFYARYNIDNPRIKIKGFFDKDKCRTIIECTGIENRSTHIQINDE